MRATRRRGTTAIAGAIALHAVALIAIRFDARARLLAAWATPDPALADATVVALIATELGPPPTPWDGVADHAGEGAAHPRPASELEAPGRRAAAAAGDPTGGPPRITGRRDRTALAHELWNHPHRYQLARLDRERARSPESIARAPTIAAGHRLARVEPAAVATVGAAAGTAATGAPAAAADPRPWRDLDPRLAPAPLVAATRGRRGDVAPSPAPPLVDPGASASEAARRGRAGDVLDAAAYSDALRPGAIELSSPRAGGPLDGARGPGGAGLVARPGGVDTAATARAVAAGAALPTVRAERDDRYFRSMYQRIDRGVRYPAELALALEQGEVVFVVTLDAGGAMRGLALATPSGFAAFDRAVERAIRGAAPFGPVPVAVRGDAPGLRVEVPYTFANPLVR